MVEERKMSKGRYFIAFVLASGIFLLGLSLGFILTSAKFRGIDDAQLDLRTKIASLEVQGLLIKDNLCNIDDADYLVEELSDIGETLTSMEDDLGKNNKRVLLLKDYYSLLEIRHMLYTEELNSKCGKDFVVVLFFYSNDEKMCPDCEAQGYVLSYMRAKYPKLRVYSFDSGTSNPAVKSLMMLNNVKSVPSVVIKGKLFSGYQDRDVIEGYIQKIA